MNHPPRITVITPCFNQARYLERSICSVLDQGYENLEYIVVDAASCDGSREILRRYEDQLTWTSAEDDGPADAINRALARSTGDIVAYHQADDLYAPFALQRVAQRMSGPGDPLWLLAGCAAIDEADRSIPQERSEAAGVEGGAERIARMATPHDSATPTIRSEDLYGLRRTWRQPARFFRKELFTRFGGFETMLHHRFDLDFHCRLIAAGVVPAVLRETLAYHRLHRESMGGMDPLSSRQEHADVLDRYAAAPHRTNPPVLRLAA